MEQIQLKHRSDHEQYLGAKSLADDPGALPALRREFEKISAAAAKESANLDTRSGISSGKRSVTESGRKPVPRGTKLVSGLRFSIFDEPTYGVDAESREKPGEMMLEVQKAAGLEQLILVSHDNAFDGKIEDSIFCKRQLLAVPK